VEQWNGRAGNAGVRPVGCSWGTMFRMSDRPLHMTRRHLAALLLVLPVLSACERIRVGPGIAAELAAGRSYADSLQRTAGAAFLPQSVTASAAISLGYLDRLHRGMGSPFRLADNALQDPRLSTADREQLAWAILARTLDGDAYSLSPDALAARLAAGGTAGAKAQLTLIDATIARARDPRAAELALRLAYALADARGTISRRAIAAAARVAALRADRVLAKQDVMRLLQSSRESNADPLLLMRSWRAWRRFQVESPPMRPVPPSEERDALDAAQSLSIAVGRAATLIGDAEPPALGSQRPILGRGASLQLAELARQQNAPPSAPVVVAVQTYREALLAGANQLGSHAAEQRFVARARNEESLVAEYALFERQGRRNDAASQVMLSAAIWLRAANQEPVWFPGDPAPAFADLANDFGLAALTFDPSVPAQWRPFYRRMLALSLADLQRVIPELDLEGLRIHIGTPLYGGAALALHDPRHRVLYLTYATGAGTIAHEIAHDLDWQAARSRFAVRGDYATDRAAREQGGAFARSVRGLVATSPAPSRVGLIPQAQSERPAEVFARSMDWLVAAALAREGRSDGYLSAAQDPVLTGYVNVAPPDASGAPSRSLVGVLDGVAPLSPDLRDWFLARYGPAGATGFDLVRHITDGAIPPGALVGVDGTPQELLSLASARDVALSVVSAQRCWDRQGRLTALLDARERVIRLAIAARLEGLLAQRSMLVGREWATALLAHTPGIPVAAPWDIPTRAPLWAPDTSASGSQGSALDDSAGGTTAALPGLCPIDSVGTASQQLWR